MKKKKKDYYQERKKEPQMVILTMTQSEVIINHVTRINKAPLSVTFFGFSRNINSMINDFQNETDLLSSDDLMDKTKHFGLNQDQEREISEVSDFDDFVRIIDKKNIDFVCFLFFDQKQFSRFGLDIIKLIMKKRIYSRLVIHINLEQEIKSDKKVKVCEGEYFREISKVCKDENELGLIEKISVIVLNGTKVKNDLYRKYMELFNLKIFPQQSSYYLKSISNIPYVSSKVGKVMMFTLHMIKDFIVPSDELCMHIRVKEWNKTSLTNDTILSAYMIGLTEGKEFMPLEMFFENFFHCKKCYKKKKPCQECKKFVMNYVHCENFIGETPISLIKYLKDPYQKKFLDYFKELGIVVNKKDLIVKPRITYLEKIVKAFHFLILEESTLNQSKFAPNLNPPQNDKVISQESGEALLFKHMEKLKKLKPYRHLAEEINSKKYKNSLLHIKKIMDFVEMCGALSKVLSKKEKKKYLKKFEGLNEKNKKEDDFLNNLPF